MDQNIIKFMRVLVQNSLLALLIVILSGCDFGKEGNEEYDLEKISEHLSHLFDVKENAEEIFVRWETPIRYYLKGLENYPQIEQMIIAKFDLISKITGLDIARHKKLYMPYLNPELKEVDSDGLSTNVTLFFTVDMQQTFEDPEVKRVVEGLGGKPSDLYQIWKKNNDLNGDKAILLNYGIDAEGIKFYYAVEDIGYLRKIKNDVEFSCRVFSRIVKIFANLKNSDVIESYWNNNFCKKDKKDLSEFDKNFLKTYYSNAVETGIPIRQAYVTITKALFKYYNPNKSLYPTDD